MEMPRSLCDVPCVTRAGEVCVTNIPRGSALRGSKWYWACPALQS